MKSAATRGDSSSWHLCFRWAFWHPAVLDAVEDLLGPDILVHSSTLFRKAARSQSFVSWHQDGHNWRLDAPLVASAWIALSPSAHPNGCLRVIPGSHHGNRIAHREQSHPDNMLLNGLQTEVEVDETLAVDVCLKPGDMSLHHVDLIHGSNANRSDVPRVGFAVRYASPAVHQERAHHQVVLARGRDDFGHFQRTEAPPGDSVAEGIAAQSEIMQWLRTKLQYTSHAP